MNILFISIAWPPPGERNLYTDLMDEFVAHGHHVFVVGTCDLDKEDKSVLNIEDNMEVLRIPTGQILKAPYWRKALSLLTLGRKLNSFINDYFGQKTIDLIIATTPPITLSRLYRKLKIRYGSSLYLLVKDIWPQGSVDLKVFRKYGIIWQYLRYHEIRTYKTADYLGTMSQMNTEYLLNNNDYLSDAKVEVCPNSIQPSTLHNTIVCENIREKYGIPSNACVFIFSGNLGKGHGLKFFIDAIKRLSGYDAAFFLIGGGGTHFRFMEQELGRNEFNNFLLYKRLPKADFDQLLGTSNVGLIFLDHRFSIPQFPSRLLAYLDASKAVLCAVNKNTDIGKVVEESECGKSVIHGDLESFVREIKFFSENPESIVEMGKNGRRFFESYYTTSKSYEIISSHFID